MFNSSVILQRNYPQHNLTPNPPTWLSHAEFHFRLLWDHHYLFSKDVMCSTSYTSSTSSPWPNWNQMSSKTTLCNLKRSIFPPKKRQVEHKHEKKKHQHAKTPHEYRTKLGMTKVVLIGSWGCHCCKTDRGPPSNDTQNDTLRKVCTRCRHCKTDRGPPYMYQILSVTHMIYIYIYIFNPIFFFIEKQLKKIPSVPTHLFQPRDPPDWRPTDPRLFRLRLPIAHRGSRPYHQRHQPTNDGRGSNGVASPGSPTTETPSCTCHHRPPRSLGFWTKGKKNMVLFQTNYIFFYFFVGEKIRYRYWKKILRVDRVHVISGSCHSHFNSYLE